MMAAIKNLTSLSLVDCTRVSEVEVVDMLAHMRNLTSLNLSGSPVTLKAILFTTYQCNRFLRKLSLCNVLDSLDETAPKVTTNVRTKDMVAAGDTEQQFRDIEDPHWMEAKVRFDRRQKFLLQKFAFTNKWDLSRKGADAMGASSSSSAAPFDWLGSQSLRKINLSHNPWLSSDDLVNWVFERCPKLRCADLSQCKLITRSTVLLMLKLCPSLHKARLIGCGGVSSFTLVDVRHQNPDTKLQTIGQVKYVAPQPESSDSEEDSGFDLFG
jgi:hypothetical protein